MLSKNGSGQEPKFTHLFKAPESSGSSCLRNRMYSMCEASKDCNSIDPDDLSADHHEISLSAKNSREKSNEMNSHIGQIKAPKLKHFKEPISTLISVKSKHRKKQSMMENPQMPDSPPKPMSKVAS